jgi:hypothetical protein
VLGGAGGGGLVGVGHAVRVQDGFGRGLLPFEHVAEVPYALAPIGVVRAVGDGWARGSKVSGSRDHFGIRGIDDLRVICG